MTALRGLGLGGFALIGRHRFLGQHLIAASSVITCCSWLPSRRTETVFSSASRLPTTSMTGTLASECSRTL